MATPSCARPEPISTVGVTHSTERLTVKLARELIDANAANRRVSLEEVERHVRNLLGDRWLFNGDTLRLDVNGRFLDGQHRVHAFIRANELLQAEGEAEFSIPVIIVRGLDPKVRRTIDIGRKRTLADELRMAGHGDTRNLAAWTRLMWEYDMYDGDLREAQGGSKGNPSVPELLELWEERLEPLAPDLQTRGWQIYRATRIPASAGMLAAYVLDQVDAEDSVDFLERLIDGQDIKRGDPVYALRQVLENKRATKERVPTWLRLAWVFVAWEHYRVGRRVEYIRFAAGGRAPQRYPKPLSVLH
jgi:hypothetical protein